MKLLRRSSAKPSSPSCPPGASTSSIVTATFRSPVAGFTRVMRLPVRSVTHSMLSGPHVTSYGPARPVTTSLWRNCFVPRTTVSGPLWAIRVTITIRPHAAAATTALIVPPGSRYYRILIDDMRPASVAFTLLAVVAVSAQPGQGTLRIKVTLVDAAQAPTPVRRHALLVSDDPPTAAPRQIFTAAD